jgi:hypothetical protein
MALFRGSIPWERSMKAKHKRLVDSPFTAYDAEGIQVLITANEIFVYPAVDGLVTIEVDGLEFKVKPDVLEAHTHVPM